MRLLIVAQTVDEDDSQLGFFVEWIRALAPYYEHLDVICLRAGAHTLPDNVRVHSLGKEHERGSRTAKRLRYIMRFYKTIASLDRYDAVFVHMNQEYVLLGGLWWRIIGRPVYLWRNHYAGSIFTRIAAGFCRAVFYTSRFSYTARFSHAVQMPVGVDTDRFRPAGDHDASSIVSLGRIAPSKRIDVLIEALRLLRRDSIIYSAHIFGDALPEDRPYLESIRAECAKLDGLVTVHPGIPHRDVPGVFERAGIFVNLSKSGMLDKTIFEAAACGCLVLARSEDYHAWVDERLRLTSDSSEDLMVKLRALLALSEDDARTMRDAVCRMVGERHGLQTLAEHLRKAMV